MLQVINAMAGLHLLDVVLPNRVAYLQDASPIWLQVTEAGCFVCKCALVVNEGKTMEVTALENSPSNLSKTDELLNILMLFFLDGGQNRPCQVDSSEVKYKL